MQSEFETNLNEYHYIIGQGQRNQYSLIQIDKTDETVLFSTCCTTALQIPKEKNHVIIKITGYEKLKELVSCCM